MGAGGQGRFEVVGPLVVEVSFDASNGDPVDDLIDRRVEICDTDENRLCDIGDVIAGIDAVAAPDQRERWLDKRGRIDDQNIGLLRVHPVQVAGKAGLNDMGAVAERRSEGVASPVIQCRRSERPVTPRSASSGW